MGCTDELFSVQFVVSRFTLALDGCACSCCPPQWVVQRIDTVQGLFRSPVLFLALVHPCSHSGAGECKAAGLKGLAMAWYAAESLCCSHYIHTHLHNAAQWGSLGAT